MQDRLTAMATERATKKLTVSNVTLDKSHGFSSNFLNAPQGLGVSVREIVEDNHVVAGFKQLECGVRADIAGPTGDKNRVFLRHVLF